MMYIMLLVGFVLLVKGADFFVEGASSVAHLLRIPSVVIGLTIVAMGTSAPEAAVSVTAGLSGNADISLSNVIGSNLFNTLVVLGACAVIGKRVPTDAEVMNRDFYWNLAATVVLLLFALGGTIHQWQGLLLLAVMVLYLFIIVRTALKHRTEEDDQKLLSPLASALYIAGGLAAIVWGGDLVVDNACLIAEAWGMSQTLIGLTIVAMGTSLPELVTSVVAAQKGETGLALGNVVGSNLFNLLFIMGIASSLTPIAVAAVSVMDLGVLLACGVLTYFFCKSREEISRTEGLILLALYGAYMVWIILR
ncbi:MAG: calcium/sodium antiporter [Oscillospiraceae bacterium]|nr:calcium/sodium antiporter [Oscillospiraceae bacterium]